MLMDVSLVVVCSRLVLQQLLLHEAPRIREGPPARQKLGNLPRQQ
jgi:hypothetical protein